MTGEISISNQMWLVENLIPCSYKDYRFNNYWLSASIHSQLFIVGWRPRPHTLSCHMDLLNFLHQQEKCSSHSSLEQGNHIVKAYSTGYSAAYKQITSHTSKQRRGNWITMTMRRGEYGPMMFITNRKPENTILVISSNIFIKGKISPKHAFKMT